MQEDDGVILDPETGELMTKEKTKRSETADPDDIPAPHDVDDDFGGLHIGFEDMRASSSPAVRAIMRSLFETMELDEELSVITFMLNKIKLTFPLKKI